MPTVYNKVTLNGDTLIDLSQDTVSSASDIVAGKVGHLNDGTQVTGTYAGGGAEEGVLEPLNDVVFVDYDGEIVQQYTKEEFLALSDMPANPTHTGLTAQGWNWSLADAKAHVQTYGVLCIGQNYTTSDGKTRFYITVSDLTVDREMNIRFYASVKGGVTVDWGDGTVVTSTANANALSTLTHTYASPGDYVIVLEVTDGTANLGYNGANNGVFYSNNSTTYVSCQNLTAVEIGDHITQIHRNGFRYHKNMKTISIPATVQYIGSVSGNMGEVFTESTLRCLVIPSGVTAIGGLMVSGCTNIRFIAVPKSVVSLYNNPISNNTFCDSLRMFTTGEVTSIGTAGVCYGCDKLEIFSVPGTYTAIGGGYCRQNQLIKKVTIPASVTSIADYAIEGSKNLEELHMLPTTPPTLANTRGLTNNSSLTIYVPYSADHSILNNYKAATNWSGFASYMQEEPQ